MWTAIVYLNSINRLISLTVKCFLRGAVWILKYTLDELQLQGVKELRSHVCTLCRNCCLRLWSQKTKQRVTDKTTTPFYKEIKMWRSRATVTVYAVSRHSADADCDMARRGLAPCCYHCSLLGRVVLQVVPEHHSPLFSNVVLQHVSVHFTVLGPSVTVVWTANKIGVLCRLFFVFHVFCSSFSFLGVTVHVSQPQKRVD
jgi:hypothetical protein